MSTPRASLRQLGLYAPGGLDCPKGGHHHVPEGSLVDAAARMGGSTACEKCGRLIELRSLEQA